MSNLDAATQNHIDRIKELTRRWQDGEITVEEKRRLITAENRHFHSRRRRVLDALWELPLFHPDGKRPQANRPEEPAPGPAVGELRTCG